MQLKDYTIPLVLALIVTLIAAIGSDLEHWLRFDRVAIFNGQLWRLLTGHLAHLGWSHLTMNVLGLALIWALFGKAYDTRHWLIALCIGSLGTSALLLWLNPELRWYVGLSGVLHTLFILGCLADIQQSRWGGGLLLLAVAAKLLYEQIAGPMPGSESTAGGRVIVDAHLYGGLWGAICYGFFYVYEKYAHHRRPAS